MEGAGPSGAPAPSFESPAVMEGAGPSGAPAPSLESPAAGAVP